MADILASVSVALGAEISGFRAGMAQARRELRGFVQAGQAVQEVGKTLTTYLSAPLALVGVAAAKVGADFESGMNRVQAATLASGKELQDLKDKAKDIALDPRLKFSAGEAAGALEALAKNGLSTSQILGGAADAAVNLATATGGQLAGSADITTDIMQNFGKTAGQLADVVDRVTGATIASKFGIEDYAGALAQAGAVSGQLGVSFEDFNTAIATTSAGFSSGSDAGTSFKTFVQRLVPQTKEAGDAMKKLGLSFFDAQGKMRPLREIAGQLQQAFAGLSDAQRTKIGTEIFGADSIRTALLLAKEGTAGFDKMAESIGKIKAASQGEILSKGFSGALEGFKSSLEGLGIAIAESGILEIGTKFLKSAADMISGVAQASPELLRMGVVIGALVAAVGPVLAAVGALGVAMPAISVGIGLLAGPVGIAVAAFAALAIGIGAVAASQVDTLDAFRKQRDAVNELEKGVSPLLTRYDELKAKTVLTKEEQEELRSIVQKVGEQIPTAITAFDSYGKAIDISTEAGRRFVQQQREILAIKNKDALKEQREEYGRLTRQIQGAQNALSKFDDQGRLVKSYFDEAGGGFVPLTAEEITRLQARLQDLQAQRRGVGGLIDELKGIQPAAAAATTSVQGLASSLGGLSTPGLTDEQTKALEALQQALRDNANLSRALGEEYDYVGGKSKALQAGIESLVKVGFNPAGKVVQGYVADLRRLAVETEQLAQRLAKGVAPAKVEQEVAFDTGLPPVVLPIKLAIDDSFQPQLDKLREAIGKPFDLGAINTDAFAVGTQSVQDMTSKVVNAVTGMSNATVLRITEFNTNMNDLVESLNNSVGPLLADFAGQFGDAFGDIVSGVATAGQAFQGLFAGILGSIAVFMGEFGKQLIAIGIGKLGLDTLFSGPQGGPLAIAAGLGLVALAGVAKSVAKQSSASLSSITKSGGGGSYSPSAPSSFAPRYSAGPSDSSNPREARTYNTVEVLLRNPDGSILDRLQIEQDRKGRVTVIK